MGILDGVDHTFSSVINGAEHWAGDVETLVEHAASDVESIGIAITGDIRWLIAYLIKNGEDPVTFLSTLRAHITSIEGDVTSTLATIVHGVMTYGLIAFLKMQVEQALSPLKDTLQQQTVRGQAVADVHRTTLNTMQTRLDLLTVHAGAGMTWQGESADVMNGTFGDISTFINQLSDQIQHNGTQARINQAFTTVLEGIGIIAAGLAILDVFLALASAVVAIAVPGIGTLAVAGIDAAVIATQLEFLLALVAIDAGVWLAATLAIYALHHPITLWHPITTITLPNTSPNMPTNKGPQITINEARVHVNDLPTAGNAKGPYIYVPPKGAKGDPNKAWDKEMGGFRDANGDVWVWDTLHKDHWDVQLPDGSHINVNPDGTQARQKKR